MIKIALLNAAKYAGLFAASVRSTRSQLRILAYHGLWVTPGYQFGDCSFMPPELFEARMTRLKRSGLPVLPLGEAVERLRDGTLPPAAVAITIDDGWVSTHTHMLPVLEALELPATLYVTSWYAGRELPVVNIAVAYLIAASGRGDLDVETKVEEIESLPVEERLGALRAFGRDLGVSEAWLETRQFNIMSAEELSDAHARGLDIQLHTHRHIDVQRDFATLGTELAENREFLSRVAPGASLDHFCYPSGTWHPGAPEALAREGVRSATLDVEGLNGPETNPYALRRLLDGRSISSVEFDAYLAGALHYGAKLKALLPRST